MPQTFTYQSEVYFDELDAIGVLHHTRYLLHLERAQQAFFQSLLSVSDFNADRDKDIYVVVHSLESRFRLPVKKPGPIAVDYQIEKIQTGGVSMSFKIRSLDESLLFCDGLRTVCKLSHETHQPCPWTPDFRAAMEAFKAKV